MEKRRKKKVMILANNDVGLYQFRKELIGELLKKYDVYISLPYGELVKPLIEMGCKFIDTDVDRRGINPVKDFKLFLDYLKILKKVRPDFVITYTIKPNIYGCLASQILKIEHATNITGLGTVFENGGILELVVSLMYKVALRKSKVVFFENSFNRNYFVKKRIIKAAKTKRLNGAGVNLDHFEVMDYPENENNIFLFMGRVMAEKGIDELFEAVRRLYNDGKKIELHVLGGFEENYEDIIKKYEAEGWLKYFGYQTDVREFIKTADCFVLPSWHEGMANTNLESASCGRPVITSNVPGCKEAVENGVTGLLCERKNANSLYNAMSKFLELSDEERKQMGLKGRCRMEKYFDKKKVVKATIDRMQIG